jgi:hypothetical protein
MSITAALHIGMAIGGKGTPKNILAPTGRNSNAPLGLKIIFGADSPG